MGRTGGLLGLATETQETTKRLAEGKVCCGSGSLVASVDMNSKMRSIYDVTSCGTAHCEITRSVFHQLFGAYKVGAVERYEGVNPPSQKVSRRKSLDGQTNSGTRST